MSKCHIFGNHISRLICILSKPITVSQWTVHGMVHYCPAILEWQYKNIRDLEAIDHLCINPILWIGLVHKWSIDSHELKWSVQVNVLLHNCKQSITSLSLLVGTTVSVANQTIWVWLASHCQQPCNHLLGKGWPLGFLVCDVSLCSVAFSYGALVDYIGYWSVSSSLL